MISMDYTNTSDNRMLVNAILVNDGWVMQQYLPIGLKYHKGHFSYFQTWWPTEDRIVYDVTIPLEIEEVQ